MLMSMLPAMAETAAEAPAAETPAETEKVDMNRLVDRILYEEFCGTVWHCHQ